MPSVDAQTRGTDLDPHDHACWVFTSEREHRRVVTSFLTAGLARGERVVFLGSPGERVRLVDDYLDEAGVEVETLRASGQLVTGVAEDEYLGDGEFDADARLRRYASGARAAVADGYTGLRVATEVSWLHGCPTARHDWPSFELRADLLAATLPFTALCAYDGRHWRPDELAVLRSLHGRCLGPHADTAGFRLYGQRDGSLRLRGELDLAHAERVRSLLLSAVDGGGCRVLDITGLTFIDATGLRSVAAAGRLMVRQHGAATIRGSSAFFQRIWTLSGLDRLEPAIKVT